MELKNSDMDKKICRTCLCIDSASNLVDMFPKEVDNNDEILVSEMIAACTNFVITKEDELPKNICWKCVQNVKTAYNFKKQCEKSDTLLKSIAEKHKQKKSETACSDSVFITELCMNHTGSGLPSDVLVFFPCEKCDKKFYNFDNLKDHIEDSHHQSKCRICLKTYTKQQELKGVAAASKTAYFKDNSDLCKACFDFYYEQGPSYEDAENKGGSNSSWQFACKICSETFETADLLKNHPCRENHQRPIKLEKSRSDSNSDANKIEISDTESFYDVDNADGTEAQGEGSSEEDSKPLSELQGNAIKKELKDSNGKNNKKIKKNERSNNKCDICDKVYSRATHLRRHLLTHAPQKPLSCKICNKGFTRLDHLNVHMHHHSDTKPFNCDICQRGFVRNEHLRKHKECRHGTKTKTPKSEFCDICKKGFTTSKYLHIHMRSHTDRIWSCKLCSEKFKTKPELTAHAKSHAASEKPFLCSECGLRFVRNDYLVIHMRRHKGEKPYKCKFCGKGFPRATDLTVHERYHTGEKTHLCTICGKGFQRAYNLLVHMRVHTGERPYSCPHCTKRFAQGNDLKAHVRRHTGERFKCDICGDGFIQGYHLTQHKRNIHGIDTKSHIRRVEKFTTTTEQLKQMESLQSQLKRSPSPNSSFQNISENVSEDIPQVGVIKIEDDAIDVAEAISLSEEQAELLEQGHEITLVKDNVAMISYFNSGETKVEFEGNIE